MGPLKNYLRIFFPVLVAMNTPKPMTFKTYYLFYLKCIEKAIEGERNTNKYISYISGSPCRSPQKLKLHQLKTKSEKFHICLPYGGRDPAT